MRLYHRTTEEKAQKILRDLSWVSLENTGDVFLSTHPDRMIVGYGPVVVAVDVPDEYIMIDDEFPDGEEHYRVHASKLQGLNVMIGHTNRTE